MASNELWLYVGFSSKHREQDKMIMTQDSNPTQKEHTKRISQKEKEEQAEKKNKNHFKYLNCFLFSFGFVVVEFEHLSALKYCTPSNLFYVFQLEDGSGFFVAFPTNHKTKWQRNYCYYNNANKYFEILVTHLREFPL